MAKRKTARQIAASRRNIKKAQIASAKKRRGKGRGRKLAIAGATGVALGTGALVARHKVSGSKLHFSTGANVSGVTGQPLSSGVARVHKGVRVTTSKRKTVLRYEHKKLEKEVVGRKIRNAPRSLIGDRPPNAVQRRRMDRFNTGMTSDQKARSAMRFQHRGLTGAGFAGRKIEQDEVLRRTNAYMGSLPKRKQNLRTRRRASAYYASQPRYDARGQSGRRGRQRSREQRNKKK